MAGLFSIDPSDPEGYATLQGLLGAIGGLTKSTQPQYSPYPIPQQNVPANVLLGALGGYIQGKKGAVDYTEAQQEAQLKKQEVIQKTIANQQAIDSANFWRSVHGQQPLAVGQQQSAAPASTERSPGQKLLDWIGFGSGDETKPAAEPATPPQTAAVVASAPSGTDADTPYGIPKDVWAFKTPPTRAQAMTMASLMMTYGAGDDRTKEMVSGLQKYGRGELGYDFGSTWDAPVSPIKGGTNDPTYIQQKSAAEKRGQLSVEGPAIKTLNQGQEEVSVVYNPDTGQFQLIARGPRWDKIWVDPSTGAYTESGSPSGGATDSGGSNAPINTPNNNPGGIKGKFWGATSIGDNGFAVYPDYETGRAAVDKQLAYDIQHGNNTLTTYLTKYSGGDRTPGYIDYVAKHTGLDPTQPIPTNRLHDVTTAQIEWETGKHTPVPQGAGAQTSGGGITRPSGGAVPQKVFKQNIEIEKNYRNDFNTNKTVQNYMNIVHPAGGITALNNPSPVSDVDAVYALVTVLDPNSVVREGEYSTMVNSQSIPESLRGRLMKAVSGESALGDETRAEMKKLLIRSGNIHQDNYNRQFDQYSNMARKRNIDPYNVVGDRLKLNLDQPPASSSASTTTGTPATQGLVRISNTAEWDKLPSGTVYIDPDGHRRTKR